MERIRARQAAQAQPQEATPVAELAPPVTGPKQSWGGWNAGNVFNYGSDLNPLAADTGMSRDELSTSRDAYLNPYEASYRTGRAGYGVKTDATSANVMNSPDFQSYVRTGVLTPPVVDSWLSGGGDGGGGDAPQTGDYNDPRRQSFYDMLMGRANQSLNIDWRKDPVIRAQSDAFAANQERSRRQSVNKASEAAGPYGNIDTERRLAAETSAQNTSGFEGALMQHELDARRQEQQAALEGIGGVLSEDQSDKRARDLANLQAKLSGQSLGVQKAGMGLDWKKFLAQQALEQQQLGLNEWDRANYWDAQRAGYGA